MNRFDLIQSLSVKTRSRIVLLVLDGGGGMPHPDTGKTQQTRKSPITLR